MTLKTRIQLSTTALLIVLLLIANTSIFLMFKQASIESAKERLTHTANNIIKELNKDAASNKFKDILHASLMSDGVIRVVNQEGTHSFQTTTDSTYKNIASTYSNDQYMDVLTYKDSKFIIISTPIIGEKGSIINLQIIENVDTLFANIGELKGVLLFSTVVVSGLLFIASWVLGTVISRPIQRLIRTMKTIEEDEPYQQISITNSKKGEINQLGMTFNSMIIKLEDSYVKQEQFVSDASHELKTPLTVISGYTSLLKRWGTTRPEVMQEAIDSIESESARMKGLMKQLLQLASVDKLDESETERVNIVPIIKDTITRLQPFYNNELEFTARAKSLYAAIHEQSFEQLLTILLDNANKFSTDTINVGIEAANDKLKINVTDKGPGIPTEAQPYIFDRMYRVDKNRSRKTGGSGLGLSIAKRICEQHGGGITLESVEGHGSTFIITLPQSEV